MKKIGSILIGAAALCAFGGAGYIGVTKFQHKRQIAALKEKTLASLVFIEGGRFMMGNYQTDFRYPSGQREMIWISDKPVPEAREVDLADFYIGAYETSYADFNVFRASQGNPTLKENIFDWKNIPDRAASLSLEEAREYCAWLGDVAGLGMRLPTEAEWEYVARSRGLTPAWPTDDGNFRPGENVAAGGNMDTPRDIKDPPIGKFPPNPLGVYNLTDGLYEWVSDRAPSDPEGAGIFKGGSNFSDRFFEAIPNRGVAERLSDEGLERVLKLVSEEEAERIQRQKDPRGPDAGFVTARCVASEPRPPEQTGFGKTPGEVTFNPPFFGEMR